MNNPDTELLFPLRAIGNLTSVRDGEWHSLIQFIHSPEVTLMDQLAFVLLMVKLAGCVSCNSDSFRAMRGCTQCSIQAVKRYRGSDHELQKMYEQCHLEVEKYMKKRLGEEKNTL